MTAVTRYCMCGASLRGSASPLDMAVGLTAMFDRFHSGDGHGPATAKQAAAVRRREEANEMKEN